MGVPGFIALFADEVEMSLIDRLFAVKRILAFMFVGFGLCCCVGSLLGRWVVFVHTVSGVEEIFKRSNKRFKLPG